ncbi:MAG: T9SS type A sorting domain-containing protein [Candidatus Cloacimonetes bacterium]|nr:T9SS type A sorting domain-containing protein [Candidatus Cloacimonadota bacterium]
MLRKVFLWAAIISVVAVSLLAGDDKMTTRTRDVIIEKQAQLLTRGSMENERDTDKDNGRWLSDVPVMFSTRVELYPTMCYDLSDTDRIFIASELWDVSPYPKDIVIKRSNTNGDDWPSGSPNTIVIEGSVTQPFLSPKIVPISSDAIGMTYVSQWTENDWDIMFRRFETEPFNSPGQIPLDIRVGKFRAPSVTSDFIWYPTMTYLYVSYVEASSNPRNLVFKRSVNNGTNWSDPVNIATINTVISEGILYTSIDQFANITGIAYVDRDGAYNVIKFTRSTDFGNTWSTPVVISPGGAYCGAPEIRIIDANKIIVVYEYYYSVIDVDVYFSYSSDAGANFTTGYLASSTSNEVTPNVSSYKTTTAGSDVYVAYTKYPGEIMVRKMIGNNFNNWTDPVQIKDSAADLFGISRLGMIVKPTPTRDVGCAVAWSQYYSSDDLDVYFDAEWRVEEEYMILTVGSVDPGCGVNISVEPSDVYGDGDGITYFERAYLDQTSVTLTAPQTAGGYVFSHWSLDDAPYSPNIFIIFNMNQNRFFKAHYIDPDDGTVTIGIGDWSGRYPIDMYYRNSLYEVIYYQDEFGTFAGPISAVTFYNIFETSLTDKPVKIWMGNTDLADLTAGWIPSTELQLVFDGTMNFPAGANDIHFQLQTPFDYTGDNLVMLVSRPMDTEYFSINDNFVIHSGTEQRGVFVASDSQVLDPGNPPIGNIVPWYPRTTFHSSVDVEDVLLPDPVTRLGSVYPNPFNPETRINFSLAEEQNVVIDIYNVKGQKVKSLLKSNLSSGDHSVVWQGDDDTGRVVGSGIYFVLMKAGEQEFSKKMSLVK